MPTNETKKQPELVHPDCQHCYYQDKSNHKKCLMFPNDADKEEYLAKNTDCEFFAWQESLVQY